MGSIGVDLGSTNIKAALYDESVKRVAICSKNVSYMRGNRRVEFDAEAYFQDVAGLIRKLGEYDIPVDTITLTGQAESLVLLDDACRPLRMAISWMDERSETECADLAKEFSEDYYYSITGQKSIIPTWPATKILHLSRHEPDVFGNTRYFVLLKDYIAYKLCGRLAADKSIATFSFCFDIHKGRYWDEMLEACGISAMQLPPLAEPGTELGRLLPDLGLGPLFDGAKLNIGTLDHFAGMIGTGNIETGIISESTGTVLGISSLASSPLTGNETAALHFGPFPDSHVYIQVAESGGYCLEWFKKQFAGELSFGEIDAMISKRDYPNGMLFLPYIQGVNAPEFDKDACGVFYGIKSGHDLIDFANAVMEGVSFLLDRNISDLGRDGMSFSRIISTGGGAKSAVWSQMKADITGLTVEIPSDNEAACLGAAMMGAVAGGRLDSYASAAAQCVRISRRFEPKLNSVAAYSVNKSGFSALYDAMIKITKVMGA